MSGHFCPTELALRRVSHHVPSPRSPPVLAPEGTEKPPTLAPDRTVTLVIVGFSREFISPSVKFYSILFFHLRNKIIKSILAPVLHMVMIVAGFLKNFKNRIWPNNHQHLNLISLFLLRFYPYSSAIGIIHAIGTKIKTITNFIFISKPT